jgi:hypothetical protein
VAAGFGAGPAPSGFALADVTPEAATDIIKWPTAIQEREFASRRAEVEAPYRRSPPDLSTPTPDDFRNMVTTVEEMKAILEWRLGVRSGLPTREYEQANAFLNQLGQEASERSKLGG